MQMDASGFGFQRAEGCDLIDISFWKEGSIGKESGCKETDFELFDSAHRIGGDSDSCHKRSRPLLHAFFPDD